MSATPLISPAVDGDFAALLSKATLFDDLSLAITESIVAKSECRRYSAGQTVYSMGQYDGGEFFIVLSGKMRVSLLDSQTGAMLIEEFDDQKVFALEFAFSNIQDDIFQHISVTAEEDLTLAAIDGASFRTLAAGRPSLMRNIAMHVAKELSASRFKNTIGETAPEQRVFAVLLKHVDRDGMSGDWRIARMPKHRELADEAGVEEGFAASAVATLIQEGVARRDYPGLIVEDIARLHQLAS